MADRSQRSSWWKFKKALDDDLLDSLPPKKEIRELRDQYLQAHLDNNAIFGADLEQCLKVSSVSILFPKKRGLNEIVEYGSIPTVVAKCGNFLKANGLSVEGIFRVGGSSKRVKQLQEAFCTPPLYGKKMDWSGYTVHDAASLLRRFLNLMPEPVIPLEMYEAFRAPLQKRPRVLTYMAHRNAPPPEKTDLRESKQELESKPENEAKQEPKTDQKVEARSEAARSEATRSEATRSEATRSETGKSETGRSETDSSVLENPAREEELEKKRRRRVKKHKRLMADINEALIEYKKLVSALPTLRMKLLLYILDLLEAFSEHSEENRMSLANLSAVFQPSILSHPKHDMSPSEYVLSQKVVEFLVEYSYKLLPQLTSQEKE